METKKNAQKPRIYTVATAHLDTIWNWDFETTVREYIPDTLHKNFALFEKYPEYVFNFEGSYRYELMQEYYPEEFEKLRKYVADGRWYPNGGVYENGDVNVPSPEALFRNVLYGSEYFNDTFGVRTKDFYLPDCFGFGWALPSIANHANLLGFTTQKLPWSSAFGIPFDLGKWQGVDGNSIYASLNAGSYSEPFKEIRKNDFLMDKLKKNRSDYDLPYTFGFHGVGDIGGAPAESSVKLVVSEMQANAQNEIDVLSARADEVFYDMDKELSVKQKEKLPVWKTELVSRDHGVGSYTSRTIGKRWNKLGELLADKAEKSSVFASWLGKSYPQEKLDRAWKRTISHQFHDDLTGTSLQHCYRRSWNDYMLSINEFVEEYRASSSAIIQNMDTGFAKGIPVVVHNALQYTRSEVVEAEIAVDDVESVFEVFDSAGKTVPSQVTAKGKNKVRLAFLANVEPLGYRVYDARTAAKKQAQDTGLSVSTYTLENKKYFVYLNRNGDVYRIFDKELQKEILKSPIQMDLFDYMGGGVFPAWELTYHEVNASPREHAKLEKIHIKENGPARIMIETIKRAGDSVFRQEISLTPNGESVNFYNEIEWRSPRTLLKTPFCVTAESNKASYDLGLGVIERGNSSEELYEFPAQSWADLTNETGEFGVSILSDCKYGWDKPDDNTLRLTGIHTPVADFRKLSKQSMMDLGLNRYSFAVYSHKGGYENGTQKVSENFTVPLTAFTADKHSGVLGTKQSFCSISCDQVVLRTLKKAQKGSEIIVRVNNMQNKKQKDVRFTLGSGIQSAREMYASEEEKSKAKTQKGAVVFDMAPFEVKTFSVVLNDYAEKTELPRYTPLELPYNQSALSPNEKRKSGEGIPSGETLPAEIYPERIEVGGVPFKFAPFVEDENNVVVPRGQAIALPKGSEKAYVVAGSFEGDSTTTMIVGNEEKLVNIQSAKEAIGAWDLYGMGETGKVKHDVLAWNATHTHTSDGDVYGSNLFFFKYTLGVPKGATVITLPDNEKLIILAVTTGENTGNVETATRLYDHLIKREYTYKVSVKDKLYSSVPWLWDWLDTYKNGDPAKRARHLSDEK